MFGYVYLFGKIKRPSFLPLPTLHTLRDLRFTSHSAVSKQASKQVAFNKAWQSHTMTNIVIYINTCNVIYNNVKSIRCIRCSVLFCSARALLGLAVIADIRFRYVGVVTSGYTCGRRPVADSRQPSQRLTGTGNEFVTDDDKFDVIYLSLHTISVAVTFCFASRLF